VRRYGVILVLVVSSHILGFAIQFVIALGLKFEGRAHVPLFLPWELTLLARTFQLAFAFGLQIASFLAVALTAFWCSGSTVRGLFGDEGPDDEPEPAVLAPPGRWSRWARPQILLPAGALLLVGTAGLVWWVREVDPRHAKVHTVLANTFFANGQWIEAEEQYRAAIRGGASDGPTWYGLAGVASRRGDHALAVERLERALEVVTDRAWRGRLESALSRARAGRPFLDLRE
jgi:tetratricopeptide (TPR) repeat protein